MLTMAGDANTPMHPGEILLEEIMRPLGLSQYRLAKDLNVPVPRINAIVKGKRGISADTALRLARYFGTTERFWLDLQMRYDLEVRKEELGDRLEEDIPILVQERLAGYDSGTLEA